MHLTRSQRSLGRLLVIAALQFSNSAETISVDRSKSKLETTFQNGTVLPVRDARMKTYPFPPSARGVTRFGGGQFGAHYPINCYYCNIFIGDSLGGGGGERPPWIGDDAVDITWKATNLHNEKRAKHKAGRLYSDDRLVAGAKTWANELMKGKIGPSKTQGVGENIHLQMSIKAVSSIDEVVTKGVNEWYDEVKFYDWKNPGKSTQRGKAIEHFTQVVWVATRSIGCAVSSGPAVNGTQYYMVCQYSPAGNVGNAEAYGKNVLRN